jgi:hypothetical protein
MLEANRLPEGEELAAVPHCFYLEISPTPQSAPGLARSVASDRGGWPARPLAVAA